MSRGLLREEELRQLAAMLPDLSDLQKVKGVLLPDFISTRFPCDSSVPVAAVALNDAIVSTVECRYALHECLAHRIWYREHRTPPSEPAAAFFGRFYATDLALRLYAGGEHLANAVIFMLGISDADLEKFKEQKTSQASIVGKFLLATRPDHPITISAVALGKSMAWQETVKYRNRWTHDQPPTISQLGVIYRRKRRWSGNVLGVGISDEPEYTVEDLLGFMRPALDSFVTTLRGVLDWYRELLAGNEYVIDPEGKVNVKLL
jgi:hypothetical protein